MTIKGEFVSHGIVIACLERQGVTPHSKAMSNNETAKGIKD